MRLFAALLLMSVALRAADGFVGLWDADIAKSRISNPQVLKRSEMTFTEKDGGLVVDGVSGTSSFHAGSRHLREDETHAPG